MTISLAHPVPVVSPMFWVFGSASLLLRLWLLAPAGVRGQFCGCPAGQVASPTRCPSVNWATMRGPVLALLSYTLA